MIEKIISGIIAEMGIVDGCIVPLGVVIGMALLYWWMENGGQMGPDEPRRGKSSRIPHEDVGPMGGAHLSMSKYQQNVTVHLIHDGGSDDFQEYQSALYLAKRRGWLANQGIEVTFTVGDVEKAYPHFK